MIWLESLSRGNSWCSRNRRGKYLESFTSSEKYKAQTSHVSTFNTYISVKRICHCFWSLRRESVGCFWCWGGIQKSLLMVRSDVEIENENLPFLYKLVGTWAFSPHPKNWRLFLDWFNSIDTDKFDPYVPGLVTSDWLHMHNSMGKRHMTWVKQN